MSLHRLLTLILAVHVAARTSELLLEGPLMWATKLLLFAGIYGTAAIYMRGDR